MSNGLGSQQDAGKCLRVDKRSGFCVELGDRSLGVSDISSDITIEDNLATHERIGT